jgi:large subunit ribosomal protein L10
MARELKQMIVKELTSRYDGLDRCVVVDLTGLKATTLSDVRNELRKQDITLSVVKNSLAIKALSDMGLEELGVLLKGPSALAIGEKDAVSLVKAMVACANKNKIAIKGSLADGQVFLQPQTIRLSRIPDRKTLLGQMLATMQGPTTNLVGAMSGVIRKMLGTMDAIREKMPQPTTPEATTAETTTPEPTTQAPTTEEPKTQ